MKGNISKDHVHIMVSIPSQLSISRLVQRLKGKSSYLVLSKFPELKKIYWGNLGQRMFVVVAMLQMKLLKFILKTNNDDDFKI